MFIQTSLLTHILHLLNYSLSIGIALLLVTSLRRVQYLLIFYPQYKEMVEALRIHDTKTGALYILNVPQPGAQGSYKGLHHSKW
jgi:hypothetical protein